MDITIKPFNWQQHKKGILHLSYGTWFEGTDKEWICQVGNFHFLLQYLLKGHVFNVACIKDEHGHDQVVGLLILRSKSTCNTLPSKDYCKIKMQVNLSGLLLSLFPSATSTRLFDDLFFINYAKLRRIVPSQYKDYPELTLLITDPQYVGKGIGAQMRTWVRNWCIEHNYKGYYLLTDASCNYGFYDKMGMEKVVDVNMSFQINHVANYDHYLNGFLRGFIYVDHIQQDKGDKEQES